MTRFKEPKFKCSNPSCPRKDEWLGLEEINSFSGKEMYTDEGGHFNTSQNYCDECFKEMTKGDKEGDR